MTSTNTQTTPTLEDVIATRVAQTLRPMFAEIIREVAADIIDEIAKEREPATMTRKEVAEELSVSLKTLERYEASGYLVPVRIGRNVRYRTSDVEEVLRLKTKGKNA